MSCTPRGRKSRDIRLKVQRCFEKRAARSGVLSAWLAREKNPGKRIHRIQRRPRHHHSIAEQFDPATHWAPCLEAGAVLQRKAIANVEDPWLLVSSSRSSCARMCLGAISVDRERLKLASFCQYFLHLPLGSVSVDGRPPAEQPQRGIYPVVKELKEPSV